MLLSYDVIIKRCLSKSINTEIIFMAKIIENSKVVITKYNAMLVYVNYI